MLVDFTSRFSDGTFHHGDPNPDAISLHTAQLGGLAETLTLSAVDKDIARELLDNYAYKPTALDTQPTGTFRIAHSETVQNVLNPPPPPAPLALPEPARIISSLITSWLPLGF
jgi:hypothetical protein